MKVKNNQGDSLNIDLVNQEASTLLVKVELPTKLIVHDTHAVVGMRPTGEHEMHIFDTINESGIRPITSSTLVISETFSSMGIHPVASNIIDDSESLMGFLD